MKHFKKIALAAVAVSALVSQAQATRQEYVAVQAAGTNYIQIDTLMGASVGARYKIGTVLYRANGQYIYVGAQGDLAEANVANTSSAATTAVQVLSVATQQTSSLVGARITEVQSGQAGAPANVVSMTPTTGGNGGALAQKFAVWAKGTFDRINDSTNGAKWDGNMFTVALGADYKFNQMFLAGVAVTYNYLNGNTNFNSGKIKDNAWGVSPYVAAQFSKWFGMDASFGYSWVKMDRSRQSISTLTGATSNVTATPKTDRWFGSVFANLTHKVNRVNLLGRFGYTHAEERIKAFTESNGDRYNSLTVKLDRLSLTLKAGYEVNTMFEPYLVGLYAYDLSKTKVNVPTGFISTGTGATSSASAANSITDVNSGRGKHLWGGGLGFNFKPSHQVIVGAEYNYAQQKKLKIHSVTARARYQF